MHKDFSAQDLSNAANLSGNIMMLSQFNLIAYHGNSFFQCNIKLACSGNRYQ